MPSPDEKKQSSADSFVSKEVGKWYRPFVIPFLLFIILPGVLFGGCILISENASRPPAPVYVTAAPDTGKQEIDDAFVKATTKAVGTFDNPTSHYMVRIYGHITPNDSSEAERKLATDSELKTDRAILKNGSLGYGLLVSLQDKSATFDLDAAMTEARDWYTARQQHNQKPNFELLITAPPQSDQKVQGTPSKMGLDLDALNKTYDELLRPLAKIGDDVNQQADLVKQYKATAK